MVLFLYIITTALYAFCKLLSQEARTNKIGKENKNAIKSLIKLRFKYCGNYLVYTFGQTIDAKTLSKHMQMRWSEKI